MKKSESKKIGEKLGRNGIAERINELVLKFAKEHPEGHYKESVILAGKIKALAQCCEFDHYWNEKVLSGYSLENDMLMIKTNDSDIITYK